MMRRLTIFFAVSFSISWSAWGILVPLASAGGILHARFPLVLLYMLGGLGPTIGAYSAVVATSANGSLSEFHRRLLRWRVGGRWYLIALALPMVIALVATGIAALARPDFAVALSVKPWYTFVPLFFVMVLGGGLEELGWRGVAQPEMQHRVGRSAAAVPIGLIWAVWHLHLFALPGVSQYQTNFIIFTIGTVGAALMLGWLYDRTESILLCIVFHAAWNTIAALGVTIPSHRFASLALVDASLKVVVGSLLLASSYTPNKLAADGARRDHGAPRLKRGD
jgi:membrane protease YdiL (CAAX protease family)